MRNIDCRYGSGQARPPHYYVALVGGITELVGREVHAGTQAALPRLEDALTAVGVAMLALNSLNGGGDTARPHDRQ